MPHLDDAEIILKMGTERHCLTFFGINAGCGWRFRLVRDESAVADLSNREDRTRRSVRQEPSGFDSFESALASLDRYWWQTNEPLQVHPDFRQQIWAAVQDGFARELQKQATESESDDRRLRRKRDEWQRMCKSGPTDRAEFRAERMQHEPVVRPDGAEIILEVGFEGGSLTILGVNSAPGWRFCVVRDETTMAALLDEEDLAGEPLWDACGWFDSLESALARLDKYHWHKGLPLQVHADFRRQICAAEEDGFARDVREAASWREKHDLELRERRDLWQRVCKAESAR